MIDFIVRKMLHNTENEDPQRLRAAYGTVCGIFGIILNLILFGIKLAAGIISGAISIISDAFNNLTDAASSIITVLGFGISRQKADKDHPFGHGRGEYISGLIVSMVIILVGFELFTTSAEKIFEPEKAVFSTTAVIILVISIAVKGFMAAYNFGTGKKISSQTLRAAGVDSISDCAATLAVLVSLIISEYTDLYIDAWCGLCVSAFIFYSGFRSAKETVDSLLGTPPDKKLIDKITSIVFSHSGVAGIHDLVVHDYGPGRMMISLHAEVPADADIIVAHDMIDRIEVELREELHCDAVIHMDPIATDDETVISVREKVSALVKCIDRSLSIHDFRMVDGVTHTNVIFDVIVPFDVKKSDREIKEDIETIIKTIDKSYCAVINIDKSYV